MQREREKHVGINTVMIKILTSTKQNGRVQKQLGRQTLIRAFSHRASYTLLLHSLSCSLTLSTLLHFVILLICFCRTFSSASLSLCVECSTRLGICDCSCASLIQANIQQMKSKVWLVTYETNTEEETYPSALIHWPVMTCLSASPSFS